MQHIAFIGAGNVATRLATALQRANHHITGVYSRGMPSAQALADRLHTKACTRLEELPEAEIYVFSVSDDALAGLIERMPPHTRQSVFVHTAGSMPMELFRGQVENYGVLYPLQTLSKQRELDFREVPLFVEGNCPETEDLLVSLAASVSGQVQRLDSRHRGKLHLAAVFACNFANHCHAIAERLLAESGIDGSALLPLIRETTGKLEQLSPIEAQTGPALRHDTKVIGKHLAMLSGQPLQQAVYRLMSESIRQYAAEVRTPSGPYTPSKTENIMINYDLTRIRAFAFDVDGVLSANNVLLLSDGRAPHRTANIKDGYALQLAVKCGYPIAVITGGKSEAVRERYMGLGIADVFSGVSIKIHCFNEWMQSNDLKPEEVLYMGDDIPDYEVMQVCGCPCCPADAAEEIKALSVYVSPKEGGHGCVRDVLEQVMRAQGKWMANAEAFGW